MLRGWWDDYPQSYKSLPTTGGTDCSVHVAGIPGGTAAGRDHARFNAAGIKLSDLDETVWERFPADVVARLAQTVLERVSAAHLRKAFHHRHFPRPPAAANLAELRMENRTWRCLMREGLAAHPGRFGEHTIGEVMKIHAFRPRLPGRLAVRVGNAPGEPRGGARACRKSRIFSGGRVDGDGPAVSGVPAAEHVRAEDPRFSRPIREIDLEAATARSLGLGLQARQQDPPNVAYVVDRLGRLCDAIERMASFTLERELTEIFTAGRSPRNAEILVGYYGGLRQPAAHVDRVGMRFGITRSQASARCAPS